MSTIDQQDFRNAIGSFATGVAIVTTAGKEGQPLGMTINSLTSVSLDPTLILWCIHNTSEYVDEFLTCKEFALHILRRDQEDASNTFAGLENDRFSDVNWTTTEHATPLLNQHSSRFICVPEHQYQAGDHIILVGRVMDYEYNSGAEPLLFHGGQYKSLA